MSAFEVILIVILAAAFVGVTAMLIYRKVTGKATDCGCGCSCSHCQGSCPHCKK